MPARGNRGLLTVTPHARHPLQARGTEGGVQGPDRAIKQKDGYVSYLHQGVEDPGFFNLWELGLGRAARRRTSLPNQAINLSIKTSSSRDLCLTVLRGHLIAMARRPDVDQ